MKRLVHPKQPSTLHVQFEPYEPAVKIASRTLYRYECADCHNVTIGFAGPVACTHCGHDYLKVVDPE